MNRRAFLLALVPPTVAGCLDGGASENFSTFERRLRDRGVDVARISRDVRRWFVEYRPDGAGREALRSEMRTIAGLYADTVPAESEAPSHRLLECFLVRPNGTRFGSYTIQAEWARRHAAGSLTEEEYLRRVEATLDR